MFHDIKTPGLNNPGTYISTKNGFGTYMALKLSNLNKTQIYKMTYRDSQHHEIEILMSFNYLNVFKPNEHTEDFHNSKSNDNIFLLEIVDKKSTDVGENLVTFQTNDETVIYSSDLGFNDIKFPFADGEENIFL